MIDYLISDGKTSHYENIKLLKNYDFDVSGAPSPSDIKYHEKMEYIPRTIRINEFTDTCLKDLAEECNISINELINAIFDGYVNKYQGEIGKGLMKERVLNRYLERVVAELNDYKLESEKKKWLRTIRHEEEPDILETGDVIPGYFCRHFFNVVIFKPVESQLEAYYEPIAEAEWQSEPLYGNDFILNISEKKWFTVMSILDRYHRKCLALSLSRKLDETIIQRLVDVINGSKTNKTLVKNLTKALRHSDRPFGVEEEGIWISLI